LRLQPGASVEVAIRPENVQLARPNGSGPDPGQGLAKVADSTFLGSLMEYQLALPDGSLLRVHAHPSQQFAVGDQVALRLDTARATVFDAVAGNEAGGRREP
jgi:ABC-type sugar transport system ATPase subunit